MISLSTQRKFWDLITKLYEQMNDLHTSNPKHPLIRWYISLSHTKEIRLLGYILSLYLIFITWGYLQEKLTASEYTLSNGIIQKWSHPSVLNLMLTFSAGSTAALVRWNHHTTGGTPFMTFWKASLAAAAASPMGYFSLHFIPYPMMILSKSSKQVPVMMIGRFFYSKQYEWYKYISVAMVCIGICIFTIGKGYLTATTTAISSSEIDISPIFIDPNSFYQLYGKSMIGLLIIIINLGLDGVTNNEQDALFHTYEVSSFEMMQKN